MVFGVTVRDIFIYCVVFFNGFNIQEGESFSGHGLFSRSLIFGLATSFAFGINEFLIAPGIRITTSLTTFMSHIGFRDRVGIRWPHAEHRQSNTVNARQSDLILILFN